MIWFSADHHFRHKRIIQYCGRPFKDADEMDEALIAEWNLRVSPYDTVWYLGDLGFFNFNGGAAYAEAYFTRLNGTKHLIIGNHDDRRTRALPWASQGPYHRAKMQGHQVVLSHYPIEDWELRREENSIHLHGHSHGTAREMERRVDVGVDVHGMGPISMRTVLWLCGM